jgi:DNA invertase Pin-like site-specific DNA recombinase
MKYGYVRVSTDDQTPALQLAALKKAGCKTTFKNDGLSGATTKRPTLLRCFKKLKSGDTLIVWKFDRLGRSLRDLIAILDDLKQRGVKIRIADRGHRHGDADRPLHVADDRRPRRTGAQSDQRKNPRRRPRRAGP